MRAHWWCEFTLVWVHFGASSPGCELTGFVVDVSSLTLSVHWSVSTLRREFTVDVILLMVWVHCWCEFTGGRCDFIDGANSPRYDFPNGVRSLSMWVHWWWTMWFHWGGGVRSLTVVVQWYLSSLSMWVHWWCIFTVDVSTLLVWVHCRFEFTGGVTSLSIWVH